ncbi:MAG TPA: hypothetical protein VG015_09505 [Candidatus Dormibacteraeota bacterium]|jgi:ATP-dependent DNA ligase|nr:hypothetical protein [Candidatus Dormibacteraeota bacterium]
MIAHQLQLGLAGFPTAVRPMLSSMTGAPFAAPEYLFEVKWSGRRCLLIKDPTGTVRLQDGALGDLTNSFPELAEAAADLEPGTILDGELVVTDSEGRPKEGLILARMHGHGSDRPTAFLAFDILYSANKPLLRQPLIRRKARLRRAVPEGKHLLVPDHIEADGVELFDACLEKGLEGIVAKHLQSPYVPGQRSPFWLTVDAVQREDFIVVGATPGDPFGALLVAYYELGQLLPAGAVAGGFEAGELAEIASTLDRLRSSHCALVPAPTFTGPVNWCRPEMVVRVRYSEWAPDGTIRFPIFEQVRSETPPHECVRRRPRVVLENRARPDSPAYSLTTFPF